MDKNKRCIYPLPKPPKQECVCAPGPPGPQGPLGPQGPPGPSEPESAFRAEKLTGTQTLTAGDFSKVQFDNEIFDLNGEYNPATSTFTPNQSGVYSICASVEFRLESRSSSQYMEIVIRTTVDRADNVEYIVPQSVTRDIVNVCTILQLQAGIPVEVYVRVGTFGSTIIPSSTATYFSAARVPS